MLLGASYNNLKYENTLMTVILRQLVHTKSYTVLDLLITYPKILKSDIFYQNNRKKKV